MHSKLAAGREPSCQLLLQEHLTGRTLRGRKLVDQFASGQRYLLITDDDNPFEEVLHIYLLDLELNVLDELDLCQPYTPGVYQLHCHDDRQIRFRFFDECLWSLQIRTEPRPSPLNYSRFPTRRPLKLWGHQYLELQRSETTAA
ncbi:MAG TPA: hypothetical protein VM553_11545 [Dongiaceae bacterium]|nr:hypothetical protein [Dongiaceae bacterium]